MVTDREDLERLTESVIHVVDDSAEDVRQRGRAVREGFGGAEQLRPEGIERPAHDRVAIA